MEFSTFLKVLILLVLLTIFGFNIFSHLAKGTNFLAETTEKGSAQLLKGSKKAIKLTKEGTKSVVNTVAEGSKDLVDVAAKSVNTSAEILQKSINDSKKKKSEANMEYSMDSEVQKQGKGGFCYVGTDRGFRSCLHIKNSDLCLSGDIFPTKDLCINPSLRA